MLPTDRIATSLSRVINTMIGKTSLPSPQAAPTLILSRTAMLSILGSKPVTLENVLERRLSQRDRGEAFDPQLDTVGFTRSRGPENLRLET